MAFGAFGTGKIYDKIREERQEDYDAVRVVNDQAFGTPEEGRIVDKLREACMGLAPMAVLPEFQEQGIGSLLVKEGIRRIKEDCPFIIVLGHVNYYPRFGFEPASLYGLKAQWEGVPDEAFMVMILNKSAMTGVSGVDKKRARQEIASLSFYSEKFKI